MMLTFEIAATGAPADRFCRHKVAVLRLTITYSDEIRPRADAGNQQATDVPEVAPANSGFCIKQGWHCPWADPASHRRYK